MAVVILHAESEALEAEALAKACERRGLFLELDNGAWLGRVWRPQDVCVALLRPEWNQRQGAAGRLRRAFDAAVEARLVPAPMEGAIVPFGWRDLPAAPLQWNTLADMLLACTRNAPAEAPVAAQAASGRRVVLLRSRAGAAEAEDLRNALQPRGISLQILGPDAPGPMARVALAEAEAAIVLLDGEGAESDAMRRWVHLLEGQGAPPWLVAARDALWLDKPLAGHVARARRVDLARLHGADRPEALRRAIARLPARKKGRSQ